MSSQQGIRNNLCTLGTNLAFTPNNAVNSVPVALAANIPFSDSFGAVYFQYGETILIESIFVSIPYQWGIAELGPLSLNFIYRDRAGNNGTLPIFDVTGGINIPDVSINFPVNSLIDTPGLAVNDWRIELSAVTGWAMNMINSPASLNAIIQYPRVFLQVRSNFNLQV